MGLKRGGSIRFPYAVRISPSFEQGGSCLECFLRRVCIPATENGDRCSIYSFFSYLSFPLKPQKRIIYISICPVSTRRGVRQGLHFPSRWRALHFFSARPPFKFLFSHLTALLIEEYTFLPSRRALLSSPQQYVDIASFIIKR